MTIGEFIARRNCDFLMISNEELIKSILPEVYALKLTNTHGHKDNYVHTSFVLSNVIKAEETQPDIPMRVVALLHDIGKAPTKKFNGNKYTFHNHETISEQMAIHIFERDMCGLSEKEIISVRRIIALHGRPKLIVDEGITDSAIRRLLTEAGDNFYDLLRFCKHDATTKNEQKIKKYHTEMDTLMIRAAQIFAADEDKKWRPPFTGKDIIEILEIEQISRTSNKLVIGKIKSEMIEMIKAGTLAEDRNTCLKYIHTLKEQIRNNNS